MNFNPSMGATEETSGRLWRIADYEFDELGRELRVKGKPVDLESKPLDILLQLLLHAGEVVTKEELLESGWPDVMVVDGSLAPEFRSYARPWAMTSTPSSLRSRVSDTDWQFRSIARPSQRLPGRSSVSMLVILCPAEISGDSTVRSNARDQARSG